MAIGCGPDEDRPVERLERYLTARAADGPFYFKSAEIADDVGLSASEVGQYLLQLEDGDTLTLERWGYTKGTRWCVRRTDE